MLQTSVEIVNPGGTGRPALVISARPEPLPPSRSFMLRLPSALPAPKKYTYFGDLGLELEFFPAARFVFFFFAIRRISILVIDLSGNRVIDWSDHTVIIFL